MAPHSSNLLGSLPPEASPGTRLRRVQQTLGWGTHASLSQNKSKEGNPGIAREGGAQPSSIPSPQPNQAPQHFPRCHQGFQSRTVHTQGLTCSPHLHSGQRYLHRRKLGRSPSGHFHPPHSGFSSVGARSPQPCSLSGMGAAPKPPGLGTAQPNTREWVWDFLLPGMLGSCSGRDAGGHSEDAQRIFGYLRPLAVPGSTPCPRSRDPTARL